MSHKYKLTLPGPLAEQLEELAAAAELAPSTLAGQFVASEVTRAATEGKVRPLRPHRVSTGVAKSGARARWLEPYGGDTAWRAEMWGQIVALHGRYPRILAYLKDEWWNEEAHIETLCALAVWRSELDDGGVDPREELAFHTQLTDYAQALRQEGGGVTKAWKPGAPPEEWAG